MQQGHDKTTGLPVKSGWRTLARLQAPGTGLFSGFAKSGAWKVRTHVFFQLVPFPA